MEPFGLAPEAKCLRRTESDSNYAVALLFEYLEIQI